MFVHLSICVILILSIHGCSIAPLKNQPDNVMQSFKYYERIRVYATSPPWTPTDLMVRDSEDMIIFFASGKVSTNTRKGGTKRPCQSLYYTIGNDCMKLKPLWLGSNQGYNTALCSGRLKFAVRDWRSNGSFEGSWYKDNSGSFLVDVFVIEKDKEHKVPALLNALAQANPEDQQFVTAVKKFNETAFRIFAAAETTKEISETKKVIETISNKLKVEVPKEVQDSKKAVQVADNNQKTIGTEKDDAIDVSIGKRESEAGHDRLSGTEGKEKPKDKQVVKADADKKLMSQLEKLMKRLEQLENTKKKYEEEMPIAKRNCWQN